MTRASVFLNNKTQAIRLPKDVAFPAGTKSVEVIAVGNTRVIMPTDQLWDSFFDTHSVSNDFMNDRNQPDMQKREDF
ncbi:type II toxin-antitoxin system VapB family antitoxin [Thalassospira alkalitolerans]|uniref:type II toxin-antitoxin system VapB family antitoxin n=1 Tax=Thalassospira alkalitolerans TaxID=1293890 RepID=UPI003AA92A06